MTMSRFTIGVEMDAVPDAEAMALVTRLTEHLHGGAVVSARGLLEARLTLPADNLIEAVAIAVAALERAVGAPSTRVDIALDRAGEEAARVRSPERPLSACRQEAAVA